MRNIRIITETGALFIDANGDRIENDPRKALQENRTGVDMDVDQPVTRERCAAVCRKYGINHVQLKDFRFDENGRATYKKEYIYKSDTDALTIWDNDVLVYENVAGAICRDENTLADCHK